MVTVEGYGVKPAIVDVEGYCRLLVLFCHHLCRLRRDYARLVISCIPALTLSMREGLVISIVLHQAHHLGFIHETLIRSHPCSLGCPFYFMLFGGVKK